jgi:replication factor A1
MVFSDSFFGCENVKISELRAGMRRVDISGRISELEPARDVQTKFGPGQVAMATVEDESGQVKVVLWNENISKVAKGDMVELVNGYVDTYQGEVQFQVGRYGKINKV